MSITDHNHLIDPVCVAHARSRLLSADGAQRLTGLLSVLTASVRLRLILALDVTAGPETTRPIAYVACQ